MQPDHEVTSMLYDWPSLAGYLQAFADNEAVEATGPCLYRATIKMLNFGGYSDKPLKFVGTWIGLKALAFLHDQIAGQLPQRKALRLTSVTAGGWRPPSCCRILCAVRL